MKKPIGLMIIFCMAVGASFGQKAVMKEGSVVLKDPRTRHTYILDQTHKYISAFDDKGKLLWKSFTTDWNYPMKNSTPQEIMSIELLRKKSLIDTKSKEYVLCITHSRCWSYFDLLTGSVHLVGCG